MFLQFLICFEVPYFKAIETGMILSIMDIKKKLLCVLFIDLYSPRYGTLLTIVLVTRFRELAVNPSVILIVCKTAVFPGVRLSCYLHSTKT